MRWLSYENPHAYGTFAPRSVERNDWIGPSAIFSRLRNEKGHASRYRHCAASFPVARMLRFLRRVANDSFHRPPHYRLWKLPGGIFGEERGREGEGDPRGEQYRDEKSYKFTIAPMPCVLATLGLSRSLVNTVTRTFTGDTRWKELI